jgi:Protein of unknown function (DUF2958)
MTLISKTLTEQLLANGRAQRAAMDNGEDALDFKPVVKLFTPDAKCTWLLTELDPDGRATPWRAPIQDVSAGPRTQQDCEASGLAFGLCDLGMGEPELGYVSLAELASVRGKLGLPIERDLHFNASKTISAYADEARERGSIQS